METRIIIAGSRTFNRYSYAENKILQYIAENGINFSDIVVVSGCADGADKIGELFAQKHNIKVKKFPADWEKYGKTAGFIRNEQMANFALLENGILIAFWDGKSSGTKHMIQTARNKGIAVKVIIV